MDQLSKYLSCHGDGHWKACKHLLRYLQGSRSRGIVLGCMDSPYPMFKSFADSDWAQDPDSRKSISGYVITLAGGPVCWSCKQQTVVALSTCEAEYLSRAHCGRQILWLWNLLLELGYPQRLSSPLFCDNHGTTKTIRDPTNHSRMKHIEIREHFIRESVNQRLIDIVHIPNTQNPADLFTKPLHRILHSQWLRLLRLDVDQGGLSRIDPLPAVSNIQV
jgi:hypothetical protein